MAEASAIAANEYNFTYVITLIGGNANKMGFLLADAVLGWNW